MLGRRAEPTWATGIIGAGHIGKRHAAALQRVAQYGLAARAVFDVDPARADALAHMSGLEACHSLEAFLERIDVAIVCTPNETHAELAIRCLEAGNHVIVEHPLALDEASARDVLRASRAAQRSIFTVRQRRFLETVQLLRESIRTGSSSGPLDMTIEVACRRDRTYYEQRPWQARADSGGVILNQGSHFIDLAVYLFGEPTEVTATVANLGHAMPAEDSALIRMSFADDSIAELAFTTAARNPTPRSRLRLATAGGELRLGGRGLERLERVPMGWPRSPRVADGGPMSGDHTGFLERVGRRLRGEPVEVVTGADAVPTARVIDRARHLAEHNRASVRRRLAGDLM